MSLTDTHSKNGRTLLDRPTYNASEAGRLADLKPDRVRRWLRGYSYSHAGGVHRQEPVIRRSGQRTTAKYASFLELVDLLFVKEFLNEGISLQQLRRALSEAADLLGVTHFARQVFFTEGRRIHLEVGQKGGKALLQLLSGGQWVIAPVHPGTRQADRVRENQSARYSLVPHADKRDASSSTRPSPSASPRSRAMASPRRTSSTSTKRRGAISTRSAVGGG